MREVNLAERSARSELRAIGQGKVSRCVLPWIPLMTGGGEVGIMERWKELAAGESDSRKRSDYAALALVFAEAAGRRAEWKKALEGWNMEQSLQVLEWMAEGEAKGAHQGAVRKLLRLLELKFGAVPAELAEKIRATAELAELDRWFDAAVPAKTLKQVRQVIGI